MSHAHLLALSTLLGGAVLARTAMLSDVAWATLGGVITALITTAGGIAIAFINRPPRRLRGDKPASPDEAPDESRDQGEPDDDA